MMIFKAKKNKKRCQRHDGRNSAQAQQNNRVGFPTKICLVRKNRRKGTDQRPVDSMMLVFV